MRGKRSFLYVDIWFDVTKCEFNVKESNFEMLVAFSPIFVADSKITSVYNFVAPLRRGLALWLLLLWKKSQGKVHCISANVFDPISITTLEPFELRANMRNHSSHTALLKIFRVTLAERTLPQYSYLLATLTRHNSEKAKSFNCNYTRLDDFLFKEATKSCFTIYSSVAIVLLNTALCRSAFSTVSFRKQVFLLSLLSLNQGIKLYV